MATVEQAGLRVLPAAGAAPDAVAAVPLVGVKVEAEVRGGASRVRVMQRYRNAEARPVEAVYVFPLDEAAAVCGFEALIGDRRIVGRVEERDQAFETYDDALAEGHGAFLLDQERPNIFTASVGNLMPGQEVTLALTYVAELGREGDALRFMLPTTISPRYVSAEELAKPQVGQPDWERVTPPVALDVPYGLELSVEIALGGPVAGVASPSHPIETTLSGDRATVRLAGREAALDHDFVLLVTPAEPGRPRALVEVEDDGTRTAMVTFLPRIEVPEAAGHEVVFLVDCSGSMGGSSIDEAKRALRLCLRQLGAGDRFNLVRFGSSFESLWPAPRGYDEASLDEADRWVKRMGANLGGTEILEPLRHILSRRPEGGLRQLILLTDGQVSNEGQVIALTGEHRGDTRIFSFGIGAGASEHLVRGVARASRGAAEFIAPGERVEPKVLRQFGRLATPPLSDVRVDAGALGFEQAPAEIPPLFDNDALTVCLRLDPGPAETVTLRAEGPAGPLAFEVPLGEPQPGTLAATLWARTAIRELEEGREGTARRGSAQTERRQDKASRRITELGLRYQLVSKHTSFVAVEERPEGERATQPAELRRVPVALTRGWGGREVDSFMAPPSMPMPGAMSFGAPMPAAPPPAGRRRGLAGLVRGALDALTGAGVDNEVANYNFEYRVALPGELAFELPPDAATPVAMHLDLLMEQHADGSFSLTPRLAELAGLSLEELHEADRQVNSPHAERIVATLLALHLLATQAPAARDEWRRAAEKAERWLRETAKVEGLQVEGQPVRAWFGEWVGG